MAGKKERIGDKVHGAPYLPAGGVSTYMGDAPEWEHLAKGGGRDRDMDDHEPAERGRGRRDDEDE